MGSCGETGLVRGVDRTVEALCLEVRPLNGNMAENSSPLGRLTRPATHRKTHSLDYRHREPGSSLGVSNLPQRERDPNPGYVQGTGAPPVHPLSGIYQQGSTSSSPGLASGLITSSLVTQDSSSSTNPLVWRVSDHTRTSIGEQSPVNSQASRARLVSLSSSELGEEEEEEEEEGVEVQILRTPAAPVSAPTATGERRLSKREKNRLKSLRRRQRRRERWRQNQLQENIQSSTANPSSSSDEEEIHTRDREGYICAVCLDVYFSPYMCHPCNHIFCEPCLRTLAKNCPTNTPCPLCRTVITHVFFQKELNHTARTFFPKEYLSRKQTFQKASCAKWPLPSCRKLFRIFGGFQRQASPTARRQYPHGGYRLDALDFEDDSHGWRFDMDMVIIYIYSVNWVIGFILFCCLCYFFFPAF
ncbi:E3 ubiquitin-protein ligase RNF180 [Chanos chanos]|uniref:E3 ubiquitin-protein ligase RNF180 n=1 Tax=Chanos chanos TaxID=29144 RepID=A0A6J2UNB4_CHACN|nr:E3 ubiquitin-protein ligase RNF180 [Chanos chanos]